MALTLAVALAVSGAALADEPVVASNREVFLGAGGQHLQYTEYLQHQFADSDIGEQSAATVGVAWQGRALSLSNVYALAQFSYARGKTAYDGFLQNLTTGAVTPWQSSTDDETTDWQLRLGKGFEDAQHTGMLTPFVALGRHRWVRDSSQTDVPYGYLEVYHHDTVEAGVLAQGALAGRLVGTLELEAGSTFGAHVSAPALGFSAALGAERVLGFAVGLDYAFTRNLHARLDYRDVNFRYRQSQANNGFLEPDSATIQGTAFLSLALGF
jgi:hypothetical protein